MDKELGCKAFGLETEVLFSDGLPCTDTIDCVMSNLDEQLADTDNIGSQKVLLKNNMTEQPAPGELMMFRLTKEAFQKNNLH